MIKPNTVLPQIASGWTAKPTREGLVAEIELAAAQEGVDLASIWLGASKRADGYASTVSSTMVMHEMAKRGQVQPQLDGARLSQASPSFNERLDKNAMCAPANVKCCHAPAHSSLVLQKLHRERGVEWGVNCTGG